MLQRKVAYFISQCSKAITVSYWLNNDHDIPCRLMIHSACSHSFFIENQYPDEAKREEIANACNAVIQKPGKWLQSVSKPLQNQTSHSHAIFVANVPLPHSMHCECQLNFLYTCCFRMQTVRVWTSHCAQSVQLVCQSEEGDEKTCQHRWDCKNDRLTLSDLSDTSIRSLSRMPKVLVFPSSTPCRIFLTLSLQKQNHIVPVCGLSIFVWFMKYRSNVFI